MAFCQYQINYHVQSIECWRCNIECDDLISACSIWSVTSRADVITLIIGICKQNQSLLSLVKRLQSVVTLRVYRIPTVKYQVSINFNMTHDLQEFVLPFTLYLNTENAPNSLRKTF